MKRNYNIDALNSAVNAVKNESMTIYKGSKQFKIPISTVYKNVNGINKSNRLGASKILPEEEETCITNYAVLCADRGFPLNREQIIDTAWKLMLIKDKNSKKPTRSWLKGFLNRQPNLSMRCTQSVSKASAVVSENNLRLWHTEITKLATKYGMLDVLNNHPELVFNLDETNFLSVPESKKVFARRGVKNVFKIANGKEKECVTAVYCISASGQLVPPMMIFKNNIKMLEIARKMPGDTKDNNFNLSNIHVSSFFFR